MANFLTRRVAFWHDAFRSKVRAGIGLFITAFTILMIFRDAILDPKYKDWFLFKYAPDWSWQTWLVTGLCALLLLTLESGFSKNRADKRAFYTKHKERLSALKTVHRQELANARLETLITGKEAKKTELTVTDAERQLFAGESGSLEISALEEKPIQEVALEAEAVEEKVPEKERRIALFDSYVISFEFEGSHNTPTKVKKNSKSLDALVVEFVNSPNTRGWVSEIRYLQAQITYFDAEDKFYHRVINCLWLGEDESYVHLSADGRVILFITIGFSDTAFAAEKLEGDKEPTRLDGDSYRVQVNLSGSGHKEDFMFNLSLPEKKLTIKES